MAFWDSFRKPTSAKATATPLDMEPQADSLEASSLPTAEGLAARNINRRLLFVGGGASWFEEFEKQFANLQPTWLCVHVAEVSQPTTDLSPALFDALVLNANLESRAEMIEGSGQKFPRAVRIVLSGEESRPSDSAASNSPELWFASQQLNPAALAETIERALRVQLWLSDPAIRKLLPLLRKLPTVPKLHAQVAQELQSPDGSLETASQFVRRDPAMAAKFLQVANSALFAPAYPLTDPGEAVMFLGSERSRGIIFAAGVFSQFDAVRCFGFSPEQVWSYSLQVASLARGIALVETEDPKLAELCFTAGLLHDIGRLVLAANLPEMYATISQLQINKGLSLPDAELANLGTTHGELGGCLLGTWSLPGALLDAVAWHHCPSRSSDKAFSVLTAVHVAHVLAQEASSRDRATPAADHLDRAYLTAVGVGRRLAFWRQACGLPPQAA
jgi:HD-like signal output (HDOD) protein